MWRKLWALAPGDQILLIEACLRLLEARVRLVILSFPDAIAGEPCSRSTSASAIDEVRRVRWAIGAAASRLPFSMTCLPRALAATRMLWGRGYAPLLVYGVAAVSHEDRSGTFAAHAWVELDGKPVVGHREAAGYTVLARFPLHAGNELQ